MNPRFRLPFSLGVLLLSLSVLAADPAAVVRVAQAPTIDGVATDWTIPATAVAKSADGEARMRFATDERALYALIEVDDTSPLKNGATRPEEMIGAGDVVALYFRTGEGDAQRVAVTRRNGKLEAWVYRTRSAEKRPYTFRSPAAEAVFAYVAPIEVEMAIQDGRRGYTLELALPWKVLGMAAAPARFGFDVQVLFSDAGGTQSLGMAWLFAAEGPAHTIEDVPTMARLYPDTWGRAELVDAVRVPTQSGAPLEAKFQELTMLELDLPRDGRLSLNIVAEDGWILRELVRAEPYTAGHHRIGWDGRDRYGDALPAGTYRWQALLFDGMRTEFMGSVGNSGRPPYRTPDGLGSMGGQHGNQKSVAADAGGVYLANALQEGPPIMRKVDAATGKALWTRSAGSFCAIDAIAAGEGMACIVNSLGKRQNNEVFLIRIDPATGQDVAMGKANARFKIEEASTFHEVAGLAIVGGVAWYAMPAQNKVFAVDLTTGKALEPLALPSPQGLARRDGKTLLICSGDQVLALDTTTRALTVLLKGLVEPRGVATDAAGLLYVSELGERQQVSRFAADGSARTATWGTLGGKVNQQIPYQRMAFRNVTGLTVGPLGQLWLAESDGLVKRYVKLDGEGKWLEDIYGPVAYNAFGPDLDDFGTIYYTVSGGCFIETRVDYAQYRKDPMQPALAWEIRAIHDMGLGADGTSRNELMSDVARTGYGHVIVFRADNGQRYFFRPSKHNRAKVPAGAGIWIERDGRWVPCAFISRQNSKSSPHSWADANGDGLIQAEEEYQGLPGGEVAWLDRDLTLHGEDGRLAPASFTASGAPVYTGGAYRAYLAPSEPTHKGNGWTFFSPGYDDNTQYQISNHGIHRHLSFWDRATENRLIKISGGKVQWIAGQHAAHPDPTEFSTNSGIAGMVDGVVLVQNIEPASYIAYTEDGFVLGDVMLDENGVHPKVGPTVINIESFTGLYLKEAATGRKVLFAVSSGDDRILEIKGPGATTRLDGNVTLTKAASFGSAATIPYATWYGNTYNGVGIDADDGEWQPSVKPVTLEAGGKVYADVRLRRDAGALYLFANVLDRAPAVGDVLSVVLANAPAVAAGWTKELASVVYQLDLTLARDKDGAWQVDPVLLRNGVAVAPPADPKAKKGAPDPAIATVGFAERWRGLGYRFEVELDMALLEGLVATRTQRFKRRKEGTKDMGAITADLPDLIAPLWLDLRLRKAGATAPTATLAGDAGRVQVALPTPQD